MTPAILATIRFMSLDPKAYASSFIYSYRPRKGNFECVLTRSTLAMYLACKVFGWRFRNSNKTNSQFNVQVIFFRISCLNYFYFILRNFSKSEKFRGISRLRRKLYVMSLRRLTQIFFYFLFLFLFVTEITYIWIFSTLL